MALNSCGEKTASSSAPYGNFTAKAVLPVRVNYRTMNTPEEILQRIVARLKAVGLTESAAGKLSGMSGDTIRSFRRGIAAGTAQGITSRTAERLAPVLHTTPEWLLTGEGIEDTREETAPSPAGIEPLASNSGAIPSNVIFAGNIEAPQPWTYPNDLPVFGTAAGSIIHHVEGVLIERDIVDYVRRPPVLMGNKEAYAVYVSGDSMYPMHKRGELKLVDPKRKPSIDDSVIVTTRHHADDPGQAYIKILKRRTPAFLVVEQINPHATLQIPTQFVVSVHKVLTMDDLFGA
jgi:phage repressor protein C with HTH and peptisase S24 domain